MVFERYCSCDVGAGENTISSGTFDEEEGEIDHLGKEEEDDDDDDEEKEQEKEPDPKHRPATADQVLRQPIRLDFSTGGRRRRSSNKTEQHLHLHREPDIHTARVPGRHGGRCVNYW